MNSVRNSTDQTTLVAPLAGDNPATGDLPPVTSPSARPVNIRPAAATAEPPKLTRRALTRAPASFAQRRLWFVCQYDPVSPLYNLPLALRLKGKLVLRALQLAFDALVERHEALRTRFISEEGEPVQIIDAPTPVALRIVDLRPHAPAHREEKLRDVVSTHAHEPFDLTRDRLFRVVVARVADDDHLLLVVAHHIVVDGWSWQVLTKELALHYKSFITEWATGLPELPIQYTDFSVWQQESLTGPPVEKLLAYWRKQLAGAPEFIELPTDRPRPAVQTFRGGTVVLNLSSTLTEGLRQVGQREGATLFMTLHAVFQVLLGRYSRQQDFIVGAPIAGRTRVQLENLIGFFVNMLPMRANLSDNPTFRELLRRVRSTALEAYAHEEVPFERIVEELRPERQAGRQPLVQVAFVLQNFVGRDARFPGVTASPVEVWTETAKLDLTLMVSETPQGLVATLEYNADLYERATAARLLGHWKVLLESVVADPTQRIAALPLLTPPERRQLLVDWNNTARSFPREETIHRIVQMQAERSPGQVAVEGPTGRLTYSELDGLANQLAHRLQRLGVTADAPVAVCLERSPEMIVAWLAVLKAGGAYVPIDPGYPAERRDFMLADTEATVLVTSAKLRELFDGPAAESKPRVTLLCVDTDWAEIAGEDTSAPGSGVTAQHLAYICYTSGSTGQPKGVCVPHRAVLRLLLGADYFRLESGDVVAQMSNAAFDAATFEVWGALFHGAKLVIIPTNVLLSPREFAATMERERIGTLFVTTGAFNTLSREKPDVFRAAKTVLTGGEAASPACCAEVLRHGPPGRLLNAYGPTECTTFATCQTVQEVPSDATSIPIGRPISNTTAYVLDERRQLVPVGVPGELYLGGDGVARGYHRRPELTAEKFVSDPFAQRPAARLYRTGDVVRWLPDGTLEFLGRVDNQVKLRGYRIELGEVEAALLRHEGVREAAAVIHKRDDDAQLVAHVVLKSGVTLAGEQLREYLQRSLPAFMVPAAVRVHATLPLTRSGKVDRAALPADVVPAPVRAKADGEPRSRLERELLALFQSVLRNPGIGVHDGFFEFGGHSLLAVRLVAQIERTLARTVPVTAIFQAQTVAKLAVWLDVAKRGDPGDSFLTLQSHGERPPLFLVHGVGGGMIWGYANLARRLGLDQPVYVLRSRGLEGTEEPDTIAGLAASYVAALREFQPEGPYHLGGYCFGGNVAYEMAVQLRQQGQQVSLLALMNSSPPNSSYDRVQLTPAGLFRFVANLRHVAAQIFAWDAERRQQFFKWKLRTWQRRARQLFGRMTGGSGVDVESMVDISQYSELERRVWSAHVNALMAHQHSRYDGPVTLFRSRGHCAISSCDHHFGWNEYAPGSVRAVIVPGAHESILEEPHVETLAGEIAVALQLCRADRGGPKHQS
ncbi:MAG: non-ribosomal peptide synthetase [Opitutus sp.]|nr:non-ribosomal peptide synthetase [Opitutus sp.]